MVTSSRRCEPHKVEAEHAEAGQAGPARRRLLLVAYACEPGRGSEPGIGYNWYLRLREKHDVSVVTRAANRDSLAGSLPAAELRESFLFHDVERLLPYKRRMGIPAYHQAWQLTLAPIVQRTCAERGIEIVHYLTLGSVSTVPAAWFPGDPSHPRPARVWGPVGGTDSANLRLLVGRAPEALPFEVFHRVFAELGPRLSPLTRRCLRSLDALLVRTPATMARVEPLLEPHVIRRLLQETGVESVPAVRGPPPMGGPVRIVCGGNMIAVRASEMAVETVRLLRERGVDARLDLFGDGQRRPHVERYVARHGLLPYVTLRGHAPLPEWSHAQRTADIMVYTSLRDGTPSTVTEAIEAGTPVVSTAVGGIPLSADPAGLVPVTTFEETTRGLADRVEAWLCGTLALAAPRQHTWSEIIDEVCELYDRL